MSSFLATDMNHCLLPHLCLFSPPTVPQTVFRLEHRRMFLPLGILMTLVVFQFSSDWYQTRLRRLQSFVPQVTFHTNLISPGQPPKTVNNKERP